MRFLYNYIKFATIGVGIACVVALGIFLWPGALAAVTAINVLGISISTVVGASAVAQVAALAGLAFIGMHVLALALKAIIFVVNALVQKKDDPPASPTFWSEKNDLNTFITRLGGLPPKMKTIPITSNTSTGEPLALKAELLEERTEYPSIYPKLGTNR